MKNSGAKEGDRVVAILCADDEEVQLLGHGVYEGHHKPEGVPVFGIDPEKLPGDFTNPRIRLDDGTVVWGFQCWWFPEPVDMEDFVRGRKVVNVTLPAEYSEIRDVPK